MINVTTQLEERTCPTCGILYAMPLRYREELENTHKGFFCPKGHERYFPKKSEEEILREKLADAYQRETNLSNEMNRLKRRVKNGVCPCCNRSFANLKTHIKTKHPGFK